MGSRVLGGSGRGARLGVFLGERDTPVGHQVLDHRLAEIDALCAAMQMVLAVRRDRDAAAFVIGMFGQLLDLSNWVQDLSPFQHVPAYPAASLDVLPIAALVAITAALTALGLAGLRRRDIG